MSAADIEAWAAGLLLQLDTAQRRQLAREIAADLRKRNQQRMAAQVAPDGTGYAPRKPQLRHRGRMRQGKMFAQLRTGKWLKASGKPDAAVIDFAGQVRRIAHVHHHGLRDRVDARRPGLQIDYPARPLLGLSDDDIERVRDLMLTHLVRG